MKKIIISLILLSIARLMNSQCDGFDPSAPTQHTTTVWDWRDDSPNNWVAYVPDVNNVGTLFYLESPFEPDLFYDDNVNDLYASSPARDYHPQDGWELVYQAFGTSSTDYVKNPGFALYNRFTGMLRSFIYVRTDLGQGVTDGAITIFFSDGPDKASAALTFVQSRSNPLDNFTTNQDAFIANVYNNSNIGEWFRSDVIMAYDPCTCSSSENAAGVVTPNLSQMVVKPKLIQSGDLCLISPTGMSATNNCIVTNGQFANNGVKPVYSSLTGPQKGNKVNNNVNDFISDAVAINTVLNPTLNGQSIKLKDTWLFDPLFKEFSGLSAVLSIVNFLVLGASKSTTTAPTVANQTTITSYQGGLIHVFDTDGISFYTPGSPHENITAIDNTNKPVYDYVLGVMNMLTTPQLEYVQYNCHTDHFPELFKFEDGVCDISNPASSCEVMRDMPQLWQFHLKEEPKFAINPASELQLLDIEYAIDYKLNANQGGVDNSTLGQTNNIGNDHQTSRSTLGVFPDCGNIVSEPIVVYPMIGPVFQRQSVNGLGYEEKLRDQGIFLTSWPKEEGATTGTGRMDVKTFSTGYFPAQCWDEQSFIFAHHPLNYLDPNDFSYTNDPRYYFPNLEVTLRVKAILRRTDDEATPETEDLLMISSYKCNWGASPLNLPFSNDPAITHTYELNTDFLCVNPNNYFNISSEFGADYFVEVLNDKNNPGASVFPIGNALYPYNDFISGVINFPNLERRASRNTTTINNATLTSVTGHAEVVAANEIIVSGNTTISSDITLKLGYASACEDIQMPLPLSQAEILAQYCQNPILYNPNLPRSTHTNDNSITAQLNESDNWSLSPNPSNGQTKLRYQSNDEQLLIEAYNSLGELVYSGLISGRTNSSELDFSNLSAGIYTISVRSNDGGILKTFPYMKE